MADAEEPARGHVHVLLPRPPVHARRLSGDPPIAAPTLDELLIADPPSRWAALGFAVGEDGGCDVGAIRLQLGAGGEDGGITGWALRDVRGGAIDGLRTVGSGAPRRESGPPQPNGVIGLDHVVVATPDFARTTAALEAAGFELRRVRPAGETAQQGFYVIGDALLEVVGPLAPDGDGPAAFWGVTLVSADLDATCAALGPELVSEPREAVQPGRRIATIRRAAGLGTAVALMSPR